MKSFLSFKLEEAKATYTIKDSEGNIKHAGTDKDIAYKTHKSLSAKEAGHKLYKNGVPCLAESDAAWAASEEKRREKEALARLSSKDQGTLSKVRDMLAKEKKPAKNEAVKQVRGDDSLQYEETESEKNESVETPEQEKARKEFDLKMSRAKNGQRAAKAEKSASGVYRAQSKIKEESLDEISKDTLSSYAHKAFAQGNDLHYDLAHSKGNKATDAERQAIKDKISKRNSGVIKAAQKMNKEDMDEAVDTVKRDEKGKVISWSHEGDWEKMSTKNKQGSGKAANLAGKAMQKTKQLSKEEVEEFMQTEVYDQLDELDKKTLGNYVKKAHNQLRQHSGTTATKYARGDKDAISYALGHARKALNRDIGITRAVDKLTKEEVEEFMQTEAYEQLDELDKDTLKSYVNKAALNARIQGMMQLDYKHKGDKARNPGTKKAWDKMSDDARSKGWKRQDGIKTAVNKLTKEETEPMLTYSEFMAQLAEGKADDLRDKLAADRERRLDKYDYSKEKDSKVSPVKNVKGHSYGAGEDSEEGEDEVKTAKPAAVKRGRGRPAGSKSGARV